MSDRTARFWANVDIGHNDECWPWRGAFHHQGYGTFGSDLSHRLAYSIWYGEQIPKGMCCLHRCDNRECVNPHHIFLGTKTDNAADRDAKGRQAKGEGNGRAILTEDQVRTIRSRYASGNVTAASLGKDYSVHRMVVSRIVRRETWAWLD